MSSTGTSRSNVDIPVAVGVSFPHPKYYLRGGDLHIIAGNTLFRVHGYFFARDSPIFKTKINPVSPGQSKEGTTPDSPIILDGITAEEFEIFLWVFYNPKYSLYDANVDTWKLILNLANKLDFKEVKKLAIRELHLKEELPLEEKMALYQLEHDQQVDLPLSNRNSTEFSTLEESHASGRTFLLLFAFSWTLLFFCMIRKFPSNIQVL